MAEQMSEEKTQTTENEVYMDEGNPRPTRIYLSRLVELLSEVADRETVVEAVRRARGFAGGKSKKRKKKYVEDTEDQSTTEAEDIQSHYMDHDDDYQIEIIEIRDPRLPVKFEKTDARVNFREADDPASMCGDCVFFKYSGDGADEGDGAYACALVEGRIRKRDTCDLHMSLDEAYQDPESDDGKVIAEIPKVEHIDMKQVYDIGALTDKQCVSLFTEIPPERFEDVPEYIPLLPKPGVYHHPRYGDIVITEERNARFVEHINGGTYQTYIPIDAEHQTKLSGAFGFIIGAKLNEDGSADAHVEWLGRGIQVLKEKRFRYISPEWLLKYEDPATGDIYEDVVIGAALTTRPFFKEPALRPLVANERGIWDVQAAEGDDETQVYILYMCNEGMSDQTNDERSPDMGKHDQHVAATAEEVAEEQVEEQEESQEHVESTVAEAAEPEKVIERLSDNPEVMNQLPDDVRNAFTQLQSMVKSQNEAIERERQTAVQFREQLAQAEQEIKTMKDDARRERYTAMVTGRAGEDDGGQWFGQPDKHVHMLEKLADVFGEDSEEFATYVENNRAIAAQQQQSEIFQEIGNSQRGTSSAWEQIVAKANELRQHSDMTLEQAITKVTDIHPELHEADLAERGLR